MAVKVSVEAALFPPLGNQGTSPRALSRPENTTQLLGVIFAATDISQAFFPETPGASHSGSGGWCFLQQVRKNDDWQ